MELLVYRVFQIAMRLATAVSCMLVLVDGTKGTSVR